MGKETAAQRKAREAEEHAAREREKAAFAATLPPRFLQLIARAEARHDVSAKVFDPKDGVLRVEFTFPSQPCIEYDHDGSSHTLYLTSESYEVDAVDKEFQMLEEAEREAARKRKIAQDVYDRLSPEEREATGIRRPH